MDYRRWTIPLLAAAAVVLAAVALNPYWTAAALIMRAAGTAGWAGTMAEWDATPITESIQQIPVRNADDTPLMRARVFRPEGASRKSALLVSGVHRDGIDEPRLVALARELAATGVVVVTPEIDDLLNYRLTPRVTDAIEDSAIWMLERPELVGAQPIGLIGVSFSGGLSVVAAGRPSVRDRVAFVLSFGGHGNLPRVLHFLCTGVEPPIKDEAPRRRPPHDYALAVLLHQAAELAVPAEQVGPLRRAIDTFLEASSLNRTSPARAAPLFDAARAQGADLPQPSGTLMKALNDRDVTALGRMLLPYLNRLGHDESLSPDRSPPPAAPVYLLHGMDDNVIPAVESSLLAQHLRGHTRVRTLLSGYLTHADVATRPTVNDTWEMIAFWKSVLGEY
jgi:dienelactone hydrolase